MTFQSIFTLSVHAGEQSSRPDYTPVATPIHNSVVYLYDEVETLHKVLAGERSGYVYSRYANPTTEALEEAVRRLEGGDGAVAFASGMAALHAALLAAGLKAGDTVVAARDLYGVTYTLLSDLLTPLGIRTRFVEIARTEEVVGALNQERPRLLLLESMSNPLLVVPDLPVLSEAAHRVGAKVVVDNTFTTPYLLRPFELGADFVVHSLTKYLAGHDDVLGGIVVTRKEETEGVRRVVQVAGRQHCENAARVAAWLEEQSGIARVYYPGLSSHPQHERASALFRTGAFGGMVSFEIREDTAEAAIAFMERLRLVLFGTTLGCIHSLILHPARTSHRTLTPEQRDEWGIKDGLLRLSVGIEDGEEIIQDLEQALNR
jgi:cystathionine gamma-synthase/methionine-gamma-lyase